MLLVVIKSSENDYNNKMIDDNSIKEIIFTMTVIVNKNDIITMLCL